MTQQNLFQPSLHLTPRRSAVLAGHATVTEVLVRLVAPPAPAELPPRPPLNLALVLDRSGSMSGEPLAAAVAAARMMVEALDERDRVSVVTFDNEVDLRVPNRAAHPHEAVLSALESIASGGSTALFDGWRAGAADLDAGARREGMSRVLLLTDGRANLGLTDPREIASRCRAAARAGVVTSTYGVGRHFDELLLAEMARAGQGSAYYGETARDLMDPFREELELIRAVVCPEIRLALRFGEGIRGQVLNGYEQDSDGLWLLPALAYGGEAWAVVRLEVPAGFEGPVLTAGAFAQARDGAAVHVDWTSLRLPAVPPEAYAAIPEHAEVLQRLQELRAADLQDEARAAARRGDWRRVDELLAQARREAGENRWLAAVIAELEKLAKRREEEGFAKASLYGAERARKRLSRTGEGLDYDVDEESSMPAFLRKKLHQGRRLDPAAPPAGEKK